MRIKTFFLALFVFLPLLAWADVHEITLKVNNPNSYALPYSTWTNWHWQQIQIAFPAKYFIEKGWLTTHWCRENEADIKFLKDGEELPFWVPTPKDSNFNETVKIWLAVPSLSSGDNFITLKIGETSYYGGYGYTPAVRVFPFYAYDKWDWKFYQNSTKRTIKILYDPKDLWPDKENDNAKVKAPFVVGIRKFHLYKYCGNYYNDFYFYWLSQGSYNGNLETQPGYRLRFHREADASDDFHYDRWRFKGYLEIKKNNSSPWQTVASFTYYFYNNSVVNFEVRVGPQGSNGRHISVYLTGKKMIFEDKNASDDITVNNGEVIVPSTVENWSKGFVGFDWKDWGKCGYDNYFIYVRAFSDQEPTAEIYGAADLAIKRVYPTSDSNYVGIDLTEAKPQVQILADGVDGDTLDEYVLYQYPYAETNQMPQLYLKIKNRDTQHARSFQLCVRASRQDALEKDYWIIDAITHKVFSGPCDLCVQSQDPNYYGCSCFNFSQFCGNSNADCSGVQTDYSNLVVMKPGGTLEIPIIIIPSSWVRFNGDRVSFTFKLCSPAGANSDGSDDFVRYDFEVRGKNACYWKKKLEVDVSYTGTDNHGYDTLTDYQVLVKMDGIDFSDAADDGRDIIVTSDTGGNIPFWIKSFDKSNSKLSLWVKMPKIQWKENNKFYIWWGNQAIPGTRSNKKETFDFWEDWESDYALNQVVGCNDGTNDCQGQDTDPHGWHNAAGLGDNYNWWRIRLRGNSKVTMADKGSSWHSSDTGPYLFNGDLRWDHYEVSYKFYDEYDNYNCCGRWGNPQYNPVFARDAGNMWGMEFYRDKYIFRPYALGQDYAWVYQSNATNLIQQKYSYNYFPKKNTWHWVKVRVYKDKNTQDAYLRVLVSPQKPDDIDEDDDYVEICSMQTPPNFSLSGGQIGFGGWNGGFSYDDIRVRKYVEPEPTCSAGTVTTVGYHPIQSLSFPLITLPLMNGRPVFLKTKLFPWQWNGDMYAYYADCLFLGECNTGEDANHLGTISLWGKKDNDTPYGFGYHLKERQAGTTNSEGRKIYTAIDTNSDHIINSSDGLIAFDLDHISNLKPYLGTNTDWETNQLIRFVRGFVLSSSVYQRITARDIGDDPENPSYGEAEACFNACLGSNYDDQKIINCGNQCSTKLWKLGDIIHSSPLVVGIPNMAYPNEDYAQFVKEHSNRDLVAYFMSNDGLLHAVRLAYYDTTHKRYVPDTSATELWAYIPTAMLSHLKDVTDNNHEYTTDGLLRAIDIKMDDGQYHTVLVGTMHSYLSDIFALDITDPQNPKLLWDLPFTKAFIPDLNHNGHLDDFDKVAIEHMGTSWSTPALGKLYGQTGEFEWVAIIGSGFWGEGEYGNMFYRKAYLTVISLKTGKVYGTLQTGETIKGQICLADKNGNIVTNIKPVRNWQGYLERIYVADIYGAVWRFDLSNTGKVNSFLNKTEADTTADMLFKPADYDTSNLFEEAKFPKRPIVVQPSVAHGEGNTLWVYFGTGFFDEYQSDYPYQRFWALKDTGTEHYEEARESDNDAYDGQPADIKCADSEAICIKDMTTTSNTCSNTEHKSWFIELGHNDERDIDQTCYEQCLDNGGTAQECANSCQDTKDRNERVFNEAEIFGGYVFFTSFTPENEPCAQGTSRVYALEYNTGCPPQKALMDVSGNGEVGEEDKVNDTAARSMTLKVSPASKPVVVPGKHTAKLIVGGGSGGGTGPETQAITLNSNIIPKYHFLLWREVK